MLLVLAAALQTIAATPSAAPAPPAITITGRRLADYAADVADCVAGHCSPKQDIVVSIRYAEALFRSGDYRSARDVLAKAVHRDDRFGVDEPVALAQLYVAQASVAAHYGEQRDFRAATYNSARIAHRFLGPGDPERFWADLRVADVRVHYDSIDGEQAYVRLAAAARGAGQPEIAAAADVHRAAALHANHHDAEAIAILTDLAATPGDVARIDRLAARLMIARIARDRGDRGATDAVLRDIAREPDPGRPMLVYTPPLPHPAEQPQFDNFDSIPVETNLRPQVVGLQWVDIGFGIRADGTVDGAEVVRASDTGKWASPLVAMIAARRYTPSAALAAGGDPPGHYRIERYTLTGDFSTPAGSLIRARNRNLRFQPIDLTDPNDMPGKKAA